MGFIYSVTNLFSADTYDSASTESADTDFQHASLYNIRPSKPFWFTSNANQWVKFDMGANTQATIAGVFNHNLTSGATVTLQANPADAWPGAWNTGLTYRQYDMGTIFNHTDRWWRFDFNDADIIFIVYKNQIFYT